MVVVTTSIQILKSFLDWTMIASFQIIPTLDDAQTLNDLLADSHNFLTGGGTIELLSVIESTGHAVAELVDVLCYKPEVRGFHLR
jgi:hypothetical protein